MKKTELTVRPLSGIDLSGVPEVIRVLPKGHVSSTKGDFEVDDRDIAGIIRQFKARRLDLVIDYEHQTLSDVQAPAAGWIKDLYPGEDALMARVEWTKKGREYIANKEYRYLSPVVLVKKADQHAAVFHSAALTNTPAITGMFAIINSDVLSIEEEEEEPKMELSELIQLLGLEEGTTEEDVLKRIKETYPLTILFITHQMEVARQLFDRMAVMENGRIIEAGDTYELFTAPKEEVTKQLVSKSFELSVDRKSVV